VFNLIKFALHCDPFNLNSFDPMVLELIREDREQRINNVHDIKQMDESRIVTAEEAKKAA